MFLWIKPSWACCRIQRRLEPMENLREKAFLYEFIWIHNDQRWSNVCKDHILEKSKLNIREDFSFVKNSHRHHILPSSISGVFAAFWHAFRRNWLFFSFIGYNHASLFDTDDLSLEIQLPCERRRRWSFSNFNPANLTRQHPACVCAFLRIHLVFEQRNSNNRRFLLSEISFFVFFWVSLRTPIDVYLLSFFLSNMIWNISTFSVNIFPSQKDLI